MAKNKSRSVKAFVVETNVTANLEVTKEDLVAIHVSKQEEKLNNRKHKLDAQIRELTKKHKDLIKKTRDSSEKRVKREWGPKVRKFVSACAAFDKQIKADVHSELSIPADGKKSEVSAFLNITGLGGYGRNISIRLKAEPTDEEHKLVAEAKKIDKKVDVLQDESMDVRRKLGQIPTYERQARAKVAEAALSRSSEGRAFVREIGDIKGLPELDYNG